jgi:predicted metalloprotease with PDZ domain
MKLPFKILAVIAALGATLRAQAGPIGIDYTLLPMPPHAGETAKTRVVIRLTGVKGEKTLRFQMPRWSPGDYHLMENGKFVQAVRVTKDGSGGTDDPNQPQVRQLDPSTWEVSNPNLSSFRFSYEVPNLPPGFFSDNVTVREKYAFYNGPAIYMYVAEHKTDPATLHVHLPTGWTTAYTTLDPLTTENGPSTTSRLDFTAPNYDTLVDSPLVAGDFVKRDFTAAGKPHSVIFFDRHSGTDYDKFPPLLEKIATEESRLMGGPPYKRYAFFLDVEGGGGGLEHLNSCRIGWSNSFPVQAMAGMAAHEFFHLWNVKRIRPEVLGPFDYIHPPQTHNLWFSEGVTSYYGDLSVKRAGLTNELRFYRGIAGSISELQGNPSRKKVSADESSYRVWEANNSDGYGGISYYLKGELIGLCLDLKLRSVTNNQSSLDVVMRDMMERYGLPKRGFPEDGIREAVIRAGGAVMGPFYDKLARSTEEMPFEECLGYAGLKLVNNDYGRFSVEVNSKATPQAQELRRAWLEGRTGR